MVWTEDYKVAFFLYTRISIALWVVVCDQSRFSYLQLLSSNDFKPTATVILDRPRYYVSLCVCAILVCVLSRLCIYSILTVYKASLTHHVPTVGISIYC